VLATVDEAELAVLGAVIATGGSVLDDLPIRGVDFAEPLRGDLFDTMRRMRETGRHIDTVTLADANPDRAAFIWSLEDHTPFAYAAESYGQIVAEHGLRRRVGQAAQILAELSRTTDPALLVDKAREVIDEAVGQQGAKVRFVRDILPSVLDKLAAKDVFVPSPWPTLNKAIGGLRPGAVYVVAARPGMGKTVIAAQLAACLAQHGMVAFSSLEMTEDELVARLIAERLSIMVGKIKDSRLTERDWKILGDRRSELEQLNIAIDDRSGVAATDVRTFARSVSRHGKLAGVVVDYMQLMTSRSRLDRHLQVAEFSRQLKIMAKDMQVPVIALSQLNRNSETSALAVPKLSDLRESGAIEQDADVVILLRREGEYPREHLILDVAKNRHGQTGEVDLAWQGEYSRAIEWN